MLGLGLAPYLLSHRNCSHIDLKLTSDIFLHVEIYERETIYLSISMSELRCATKLDCVLGRIADSVVSKEGSV